MVKTKQAKPQKSAVRKKKPRTSPRRPEREEPNTLPAGFGQLSDDQQLALLKELAGSWADDTELATIFKQMAQDVRKRRKSKKVAS